MTNVQLREELFREINPLLDNDFALKKVLVFLRTITSKQETISSVDKKQKRVRLADLEIPDRLHRKRGCIRLTEEDLKDERIQYILSK